MITAEELNFLRESNNIEDERDDKSLQDAILAWQYCKKAKKLTRKVVLDVHGLLMQSRDTLEKKDKGKFRDGPVWIGGHEAIAFYAIENRLVNWLERVDFAISEKYLDDEVAVIDAKEHHIAYEAIHPFFDGNGRTGRIFYNWQRVKVGLPIHVIHVGKEQEEYYDWFN